jgi:drug/metabolite transporter (DMT)-like permease
MQKRASFWAKAALFAATLIWGFSFVVVKNSVNEIGSFYLMAIRFTSAAATLSIVFFRRLKKLDLAYVRRGFALGTLLFFAYALQTVGITMTTPGKNAFLTAIYCVLVPFLYWAIEKSRPAANQFAASFACLVGIGLVSLDGRLAMGMGDALSLACGLFYALHAVFVSRYAKDERRGDAFLLTILQFAFAGAYSWAAGLCLESFPASFSKEAIASLLFLSIFATSIALLFQTVGQKYTHPALAAVIMSLEGVFGVGFSLLFGMEELSLRMACGFALIFAAEIAAQLKLQKNSA